MPPVNSAWTGIAEAEAGRDRMSYLPAKEPNRGSDAAWGASDGVARPRITVIVPTLCRRSLEGCLTSIVKQTVAPDEVVIVKPTDSTSCDTVVHGFADLLPIRRVTGSEQGIVAAVNLGLADATGDVVCLVDDDAEAPAHWLERIGTWFLDPTVGAVGGPHVSPGKRVEDLPPVSRWDRLLWFGYSSGPRTDGRIARPQEAHFLAEGGLAFRRTLVPRIDDRLVGRDERFGDDVTFTMRRRGLRVIADPELYVWHAHVRFDFDQDRLPAPSHVYATAHNQTYLWLKHFPPGRRAAFLPFGLLVGDRTVKGVAAFIAWGAKNLTRPRRLAGIVPLVSQTFLGRAHGIRTYLAATRS
jgi:glycosyltransferase involved in cell wall biosynthesis